MVKYLLKDVSPFIVIHNRKEEFVREGRRVSPRVSQHLVFLISLPVTETFTEIEVETERENKRFLIRGKPANIMKATRRNSLEGCHLTVTFALSAVYSHLLLCVDGIKKEKKRFLQFSFCRHNIEIHQPVSGNQDVYHKYTK